MTSDVLSSLRFALRDGTRSAHERLDAMAGAFDLSHEGDYGRFLFWHARIVPHLEDRLDRLGIARIFPDWPDRRRAHMLLSDLKFLGHAVPTPFAIGPGTGLPDLIGATYVLEGSRLGGAMLARSVAPNLQGLATRYLDHGAGLKFWPRFVDRLNAIELSGAETQVAITAANRVFEAFEHCLVQIQRDGGHSGP